MNLSAIVLGFREIRDKASVACWLVGLVLCPMIVGCDGCQKSEPKSIKPKPLKPFFTKDVKPIPSAEPIANYRLKPGHWFTAIKPLRSNLQDYRGELRVSVGEVHSDLQATELSSRKYIAGALPARRPVVLPKGRMKHLTYRMLAPSGQSSGSSGLFLRNQFVTSSQGVLVDSGSMPIVSMQPQEYFFIVLTNRPESFAFLQSSSWASVPISDNGLRLSKPVFRIVIPDAKGLIAIPDSMLDWTSTAYLLWDNLSPDRLMPSQIHAIKDWVHWGGRMIVNGPDAGTLLQDSDFTTALPMTVERTVELETELFANMLRDCSVKDDPSTDMHIAVIRSKTGLVGIDGPANQGTRQLSGTHGLVLERRMGRGNVVQTRFDVVSALQANWKSRDSFFNSVMLRRPGRRHVNDKDLPQQLVLADETLHASTSYSPLLNTSFRIHSRDGLLTDLRTKSASSNQGSDNQTGSNAWEEPGRVVQARTGVAAWTDRSDTAVFFKRMLQEEAGIEIPSAKFVFQLLVAYLIILVPLNYAVFRFLGRLEWAWVAVPVIAIFGAAWVARAAQLDIGFARSQTEIGLLETQPGHDRGHLSSFVAIYNSLSSTYAVSFDTPDAAAAPDGVFEHLADEATPQWNYGYDLGPSLSKIKIASNQTRVVHAEQIVDVGGSIHLTPERTTLVNDSLLTLTDAVVVRKTDQGDLEVAYLDDCASGGKRSLSFKPFSTFTTSLGLPLQTGRLMRRLIGEQWLRNGECNLVARAENSPSFMTVTPAASQQRRETVLLAHLTYPQYLAPMPDVNLAVPATLDDEDT